MIACVKTYFKKKIEGLRNIPDRISKVPKKRFAVAFALSLTIVIGMMASKHIALTLTPSLDKSLFYLTYTNPGARAMKRDYVMFTLPPELMKQIKNAVTNRAIKQIGCNGGDHLYRRGQDFYCNDEYLGTAKTATSKGEPLPVFNYDGVVPQGSVFVVGSHPLSYDSRYLGFVSRSGILAVAHPII